MIEREYYSLEQAAEILPYSSDELLHMGANGKLDIFVLVGGHAITKKTVIDNAGSEVAVSFGAFPGSVVPIERTCIQSHEAGLPARVTLVIYYGRDGGNSEVLTIVDPREKDGDLIKAGDFMMEYAKLVIMAADLKRLQEPVQQIENVTTDDTIQPRAGGYFDRDEFAIAQVKDKPGLLSMRPARVKAKLLELQPTLFAKGYASWWRDNKIFPKGKPGRNPRN